MSNVAISSAKLFGGGYIYGVQTVAPGGVADSLLLPNQFATIQSASVDIAKTVKELRGSFEDAEDLADGSRKITGKIESGRVSIQIINQLIFAEPGGTNFTNGTVELSPNEKQTVGNGPYTVTVNNAVDFEEDLGVSYFGTSLVLQPVQYVASPLPTLNQGQYYVNPNTGVYTFAAADAGAVVLISYRYTDSTSGHTLTVNSLIMGSSRPSFSALFQNPYNGDQEILLFNCKATKLSFAIKQEEYTHMDIDFMASANASGQTIQFLSSF